MLLRALQAGEASDSFVRILSQREEPPGPFQKSAFAILELLNRQSVAREEHDRCSHYHVLSFQSLRPSSPSVDRAAHPDTVRFALHFRICSEPATSRWSSKVVTALSFGRSRRGTKGVPGKTATEVLHLATSSSFCCNHHKQTPSFLPPRAEPCRENETSTVGALCGQVNKRSRCRYPLVARQVLKRQTPTGSTERDTRLDCYRDIRLRVSLASQIHAFA